MSMTREATAFGPATVGNIAVGFDLLGHALASGVGDRVTVRRAPSRQVRIMGVSGCVSELPRDPTQNTATAGLVRLIEELELSHGFEVWIEKGIALGSGMGGSAASAAAGVMAASAVLDTPLSDRQLYAYGLLSEAVATGAAHGDNLAPCLFGGVQMVLPGEASQPWRPVSAPPGLFCALAHPEYRLDTRVAREALRGAYGLHEFVAQVGYLAAFLDACWRSDAREAGLMLRDVLVEPRRAALIPGFEAVKSAALAHGALGCSISGAGPSVFAWCEGEDAARTVSQAMVTAFHDAAGLRAHNYVSRLDAPGARVEHVADIEVCD